MIQLTVRKVGNSLGVILPQEALALLQAKEGDVFTAIPDADGLRLTRADSDFERQMKIAEGVMNRYRNTLRKLAE